MNEPTLTESMQTDLPSHKPNRRKRLALRFAVLVVAVSMLVVAYWFTRPPELVWWTSPPIGRTRRRAKLLLPNGWMVKLPVDSGSEEANSWIAIYELIPCDNRPWLLKWIRPDKAENAQVSVATAQYFSPDTSGESYGLTRADIPMVRMRAGRAVTLPTERIAADVVYERTNLPAFNRTYRQICNSLTIE